MSDWKLTYVSLTGSHNIITISCWCIYCIKGDMHIAHATVKIKKGHQWPSDPPTLKIWPHLPNSFRCNSVLASILLLTFKSHHVLAKLLDIFTPSHTLRSSSAINAMCPLSCSNWCCTSRGLIITRLQKYIWGHSVYSELYLLLQSLSGDTIPFPYTEGVDPYQIWSARLQATAW